MSTINMLVKNKVYVFATVALLGAYELYSGPKANEEMASLVRARVDGIISDANEMKRREAEYKARRENLVPPADLAQTRVVQSVPEPAPAPKKSLPSTNEVIVPNPPLLLDEQVNSPEEVITEPAPQSSSKPKTCGFGYIVVDTCVVQFELPSEMCGPRHEKKQPFPALTCQRLLPNAFCQTLDENYTMKVSISQFASRTEFQCLQVELADATDASLEGMSSTTAKAFAINPVSQKYSLKKKTKAENKIRYTQIQ